MALRTSATTISRGALSSGIFVLSGSSIQVRGSTHRPIPIATTGSTQSQPVKRITRAATMTPREPSMSAQTSRYAPLTLRLLSLPAHRSEFWPSVDHGGNDPVVHVTVAAGKHLSGGDPLAL